MPARSSLSILIASLAALASPILAERDWRRTALTSAVPSNEILRLDADGDGRPDVLERWWNGKRVRWLDENGDLGGGDTRGDQVGDLLQVDVDGDGTYDGP